MCAFAFVLASPLVQVEWVVKEPSYFFKLSEWGEPLKALLQAKPDWLAPPSRRNEVRWWWLGGGGGGVVVVVVVVVVEVVFVVFMVSPPSLSLLFLFCFVLRSYGTAVDVELCSAAMCPIVIGYSIAKPRLAWQMCTCLALL